MGSRDRVTVRASCPLRAFDTMSLSQKGVVALSIASQFLSEYQKWRFVPPVISPSRVWGWAPQHLVIADITTRGADSCGSNSDWCTQANGLEL